MKIIQMIVKSVISMETKNGFPQKAIMMMNLKIAHSMTVNAMNVTVRKMNVQKLTSKLL